MKIDKNKLLQDIEEMKEKLASMEEELNKPEVFKHFPSIGEVYFFYTSSGSICSNDSSSDDLKVNAYKTREEASKAYNKAIALEKVKRRIIELQGDWEPDWMNKSERKFCIFYRHTDRSFRSDDWAITHYGTSIPCMKNKECLIYSIDEVYDVIECLNQYEDYFEANTEIECILKASEYILKELNENR